MKYLFLFLFLFSFNFAISSDYLVTENITIYSGENYNGWSNAGQYTRILTSSTGTDSTVITNLSVNVANIIYYFNIVPSSIKTSDKELYDLYLKYCNTVVLDTIKLSGYSTIPLVEVNGKLTQQIIFNSRNNYNQYKFKRYKNVPVTETRIPTFTGNKIIHYTDIIYHTLQRQANADDFYSWYYPTVKYKMTEKFITYTGDFYNGWSITSNHTRTLKSKFNTDSIIITNLTVKPITNTYNFGELPKTLNPEDIELYKLYLNYCNKLVLDTVKLAGYTEHAIIVQNSSGTYITQQIIFNSRNNFNQYKFRKYKNVSVTDTRVPTFNNGNTIYWVSIVYYTLQRQSSLEDFYASIDKLPIFGIIPSEIKVQDRLLYQQYLIYCNKMSLDSVKIIGYKTVPLDTITTLNGKFLTQNIVVSSRNNYNQYRFKKYKNIPSAETRVPTFSSGKVAHWITIQYYVLQRQNSIYDFNNWYLKLAVKP